MEDDRYVRITLRIPKGLHAALTTEADATSKSLNAEIVGRLQQSFDGTDALPGGTEKLIQEIVAKTLKEAVEAIKKGAG